MNFKSEKQRKKVMASLREEGEANLKEHFALPLPHSRFFITGKGKILYLDFRIGNKEYHVTQRETLTRGRWAMHNEIFLNSQKIDTGDLTMAKIKKAYELAQEDLEKDDEGRDNF